MDDFVTAKDIIKYGKKRIENKDVYGIEELYANMKTDSIKEYQLNYAHIYKHLFLHACLKNNSNVIIFLTKAYFNLSLCDKLALRQTVFYGKYLIPKKNKETIAWYNDCVIPIFRNI